LLTLLNNTEEQQNLIKVQNKIRGKKTKYSSRQPQFVKQFNGLVIYWYCNRKNLQYIVINT